MKKFVYALVLLVLLVGSFLAGSWYSKQDARQGLHFAARRVLYYVDPMNPAHTSDKPGVAPCGMKMEPVYADSASGQASGNVSSSMPPGTVGSALKSSRLSACGSARWKRPPEAIPSAPWAGW